MVATAQEATPTPNITGATWREYRDYYPQSPACDMDEITLWSCETTKNVYSLCSSTAVGLTSGYIQYRALSAGKVTFVYPAEKKPPLGYFTFHSSPSGDASIEFKKNGYLYHLNDRLRGSSSILVDALNPSGKSTEIECGSNQTLQLNYTLRLMHESGIWPDH